MSSINLAPLVYVWNTVNPVHMLECTSNAPTPGKETTVGPVSGFATVTDDGTKLVYRPVIGGVKTLNPWRVILKQRTHAFQTQVAALGFCVTARMKGTILELPTAMVNARTGQLFD